MAYALAVAIKNDPGMVGDFIAHATVGMAQLYGCELQNGEYGALAGHLLVAFAATAGSRELLEAMGGATDVPDVDMEPPSETPPSDEPGSGGGDEGCTGESCGVQGQTCFPAGTLVQTDHGSVAIETLKVGDTVLAEYPATRKVRSEPVTALIVKPVSPLLDLYLSDGSTIKVTANHPFFVDAGPGVERADWVDAGTLQVGDKLRTESGKDVTILATDKHAGYAVVYTLTVANDHDYFVGSARVLVHNAQGCGPALPEPILQRQHIFPQQFRQWFADRGIDVDEYTVALERQTHLAGIHGRGGFVGPGDAMLPGGWNDRWAAFIAANKNANAKAVFQFAGHLMDEYGLSGLPIVPYR
jgi:hypothetical protein